VVADSGNFLPYFRSLCLNSSRRIIYIDSYLQNYYKIKAVRVITKLTLCIAMKVVIKTVC